jgi:hypothetical protein
MSASHSRLGAAALNWRRTRCHEPLWDHVVGLAGFPGFAQLKRSLRERPQLRSFGVDTDQVGIQEDWHGGSRRTKK